MYKFYFLIEMNNMYYYPIFDIPIACHYGAFLKRQNDSYLHIMCNLEDTLLISTQHVLCKMSHLFDTQMPILMTLFNFILLANANFDH